MVQTQQVYQIFSQMTNQSLYIILPMKVQSNRTPPIPAVIVHHIINQNIHLLRKVLYLDAILCHIKGEVVHEDTERKNLNVRRV